MAPTTRFVYLVFDGDGAFVNAYATRDLAISDLPEAAQAKRQQLNRTDWAYGAGSKKWKVLERRVLGSDGLALPPKEYRQ